MALTAPNNAIFVAKRPALEPANPYLRLNMTYPRLNHQYPNLTHQYA